jgi:hypothetical protein
MRNPVGVWRSVGEFNFRTCFVAGTKVKTPSGYRNIEDISAGDKVLSYNETTKRLEVQTVAQTFIRKTDRIYTLVYDTGTKLQTTATHPFYIEGKGWVKAADLLIGDDSLLAGEVSPLDIYGGARLQNVSYRQSKQGVIVGITVEERPETVYNFEVNETHTYLVGESDVVVHNAAYDMQCSRAAGGYCDLDAGFTLGNSLYNRPGETTSVRFTLTDSDGKNRMYKSHDGKETIIYQDGVYRHEIEDQYDNHLVFVSESIDGGRPVEMIIDGKTVADGGLVNMDPNGKMRVWAPTQIRKGAVVLVLGQDNDAMDSLSSLDDTRRHRGDSTYMVYNPTRGVLADFGDSGTIRNNPGDTQTRPAIQTVSTILQTGNVSSIACHSQGGAICANGAADALDNQADLRNTNFIFVGGAQTHLPEQFGRLRVIENTNDWIRRDGFVREQMNARSNGADARMYAEADRRGAYRRGNDGGHGYQDNYARIVACQSLWKDVCN